MVKDDTCKSGIVVDWKTIEDAQKIRSWQKKLAAHIRLLAKVPDAEMLKQEIHNENDLACHFTGSSPAPPIRRGMKLVPVAGLSRRARKLLQRCLSFERNDRPQTADRFLKLMQPSLMERMLA
ncbi:MAG TPA: hypothetical protein VIT67_14570 [Povalibacter sp.]